MLHELFLSMLRQISLYLALTAIQMPGIPADVEKATTKLAVNKVENAPANIFRGGISAGCKNLLVTAQLSHVGETFADANNTVTPLANGQTGLIPSTPCPIGCIKSSA